MTVPFKLTPMFYVPTGVIWKFALTFWAALMVMNVTRAVTLGAVYGRVERAAGTSGRRARDTTSDDALRAGRPDVSGHASAAPYG